MKRILLALLIALSLIVSPAVAGDWVADDSYAWTDDDGYAWDNAATSSSTPSRFPSFPNFPSFPSIRRTP